MKLIELVMVSVVVTATCVGGKACFNSYSADTVKLNAEEDALKHCRRVHSQWSSCAADCQGIDSDGDGYVRCAVTDGADREDAIECRVSRVFSYQRGCVPMRNTPRRR